MKETLLEQYEILKSRNYHLDMSRGKPCKEQLDLNLDILSVINDKNDLSNIENVDVLNYGSLTGLKECKDLLLSLVDTKEDIIIFNNSSLNIMYDCLSNAFIYGICGNKPFSQLKKIKWLCIVPGYDRHFAMSEHLGIEMINIPLKNNQPDMDLIEQYIKDVDVKGIWCVPKYSNPSGITYSKEVVERFAKLKPASKDFRIYWDNAYCVHDLYNDKQDTLEDIFEIAKKYNNEDLIYEFVSTSKITFPGSGVSGLIASKNNIEDIKNHLKYKTIGGDKINQLRHAKYLKDIHNVKLLMQRHANIIRPKFEYIEHRLEEIKDIVRFNNPLGGYFISLYVSGIAKQVVDRCKECGLKLTEAGSSYPYHIDKDNSHIRIAPTFLSMDELEIAMDILILSIKIEENKNAN